MSKKLIAGLGTVAALGIAALPLAGVFAVDDSAETIVRVNVPESVQCQSAGTDTDFVWFGNVAIGVDADEALSVTGSTNSSNGFTITGTATNMVSGTLADKTQPDVRDNVFTADTSDASTIGYNKKTAGDGKWWLTTTDNNVSISESDNTITLTGVANNERTFNMTANVRPAYTNKPGIYQGEINWVCAVNPAQQP
ncbi:MAG: hypothetical protein K6G36_01180 [Candidatus Saccharibacteria bacterium]|nr:hypothetical protein [Candidatus Saccharibacteria bacterium]